MKLFLPQQTLEEWLVAEQVDLNDNQLVVRDEQASYGMAPAVHFQKLVTGDDLQRLVGRVKMLKELTEMGAEHLADSVILGETAYQVAEGYVMQVAAPKQAVVPAAKKPASSEAEALAAFILDRL